jgi:hypothetical protein
LGFVRLTKYLFQVSDSSGDLERHHQLRDWGFLVYRYDFVRVHPQSDRLDSAALTKTKL